MDFLTGLLCCLSCVATGAIIGALTIRKLSNVIITPLIKEIHYMVKHISAHDLQVYHGINETDWGSSRPHADVQAPSPMWDQEAFARELERFNGDLPPSAE